MLLSLVWLCLFLGSLHDSEAIIIFTAEPQDNCVYEGNNTFFECEYNGTRSRPSWLINGEAISLPPRHRATEKGVNITNVDKSMNNWTYACFFVIFSGSTSQTIISREGRLKVLQLPIINHDYSTAGYDEATTSNWISPTTTMKITVSLVYPSLSHGSILKQSPNFNVSLSDYDINQEMHQDLFLITFLCGGTILLVVIASTSFSLALILYLKSKRRRTSMHMNRNLDDPTSNSTCESPVQYQLDIELSQNDCYHTVRKSSKLVLKKNLAYETVVKQL